jgi:hypothetical protein
MPALRDKQEVLVSFFVMSTALCALVLSWWQVHLSQKHYRLSTQPSINIGTVAKRPNAQSAADDDEGLYLRNKGLGPARVKSIVYFVDMARVAPAAGQPEAEFFALENIANDLVTSGVVKSLATDAPEVGDYIKENDQIKLLTVKSSNVVKRDAWLAFLDKRVGMMITYCSIYEECWASCYKVAATRGITCN